MDDLGWAQDNWAIRVEEAGWVRCTREGVISSRVKWWEGAEDLELKAEEPCGNHVQFAQPNALKPA